MFENICSIPLRADIFTQAIHPTQPIFAVGLASGHVQTFRLPALDDTPSVQSNNINKSTSNGINKPSALSSKVRNGRRSSDTGFGMVDEVWATRRHKGSCRTMCLNGEGDLLYSAGTDGIVKAAWMETGEVIGKIGVPLFGGAPDEPSALHALSPQTLLLGTDSGLLHLYDLRTPSSSTSPFTTSRPSQSHTPHTAKDDTTPNTEPITSLTPLPPTSASTSGTSRTWISTAGSTLAVTDLRKGVVTLSEDQGDMLLSSACVSGLSLSKSAKRRRAAGNSNADTSDSNEKIIVGADSGIITLWDRGQWTDQSSRVRVGGSSDVEPAIPSGTRGFGAEAHDDDCTVDCLSVIPESVAGLEGKARGGRLVVAGLGNGGIRVVRLRGGGGEVVGALRHDETGVEGVGTLGFESQGRMVSGGGMVVKVWTVGRNREEDYHEEIEVDEDEEDDDDEEAEPVVVMGSPDNSDDDDDDDDDSDNDRQRKKRKKGAKKRSKGGSHGISGSFGGMD